MRHAQPRRFDLVAVGGGPAGEKAAAQAAYCGKTVVLVDRLPHLGGTMVGGAVSSKTMREAALYLTGFQGREAYDISLDLPAAAAMSRLRSRTDHVVDVMARTAQTNMARHNVEVIVGHARVGPDRTVQMTEDDGSSHTLRAHVVLLAPGSHAFHPPGIPFDDPDVLDADEAAHIDAHSAASPWWVAEPSAVSSRRSCWPSARSTRPTTASVAFSADPHGIPVLRSGDLLGTARDRASRDHEPEPGEGQGRSSSRLRGGGRAGGRVYAAAGRACDRARLGETHRGGE